MPDTEALLADWQTKTDAATEGPWEALREHHTCYIADDDECRHPESPIIDRTVFRVSEGAVKDAVYHEHESYEAHTISPQVAGNYDYEEGGIIHTEDAEFIATARTAMPRLLAAVEAIRALHRPETRYVARGYEEYSFETRSDALEYGEEVTTFDVCVHCGRVETDDDEDRRYRDSIWPCATAKALDAALRGSEPDEGNER